MALESTQPLTEMCTRNISLGVKEARCIMLTTLPLSCADCLEFCEPQPSGTPRACPGLYKDCFTFTPTIHGMGRDNLTLYMAYVACNIIFIIHSCEIISQFMVIFLINSQN